MADVFISYKREDRASAERVDAALRGAGHSTWWDTSLVAGEQFNEAIDRELRAARCVVVLWSETAHKSRWVQAEAISGFDRGMLVSARLDDVVLGYPFSIVQTVDMRRANAISKIVEGASAKLGNPSHAHQPQASSPTHGASIDQEKRFIWIIFLVALGCFSSVFIAERHLTDVFWLVSIIRGLVIGIAAATIVLCLDLGARRKTPWVLRVPTLGLCAFLTYWLFLYFYQNLSSEEWVHAGFWGVSFDASATIGAIAGVLSSSLLAYFVGRTIGRTGPIQRLVG